MRVCPGCRTCYEEDYNVCPKDGLPLIDRAPTFALVDGKRAPPQRDAAGTKIRPGLMIGEYKVEKVLAEGGMGVIYAGIHPLISKRVAIKVLNRRFAQDPKAVSRFVLEARSVNEIGHHNIVDIFSIGELDDGRNYLIMELLEGMPLHEILMRVRRLKPGEVLPVYEQLCDALAGAHSKGFVHRDLKPDNIVVLRRPPHPFIKILDFGLAKLRGSATSTNTEVGTVLGTPEYMAPEQCRGKQVDARTDIYALGVMLYELLTGRRPFTDASPLRVLSMQQRDPPEPPSMLAPVSEEMEWLILKAMAKDPAQRFTSVHELLAHLGRVCSDRLPWGPILDSSWDKPRPAAAPQAGASVPMAIPPKPREVRVPRPVAISDEVIPVPAPQSIPQPLAIAGELIDDDSETIVSSSEESAPRAEHPDAILQKLRETLPDQPTEHDQAPAVPAVRNVRLGPAEARAPAPFLGTPGSDELEDMGATEITDPPDQAAMLALAKASDVAAARATPNVDEQPTNVDPVVDEDATREDIPAVAMAAEGKPRSADDPAPSAASKPVVRDTKPTDISPAVVPTESAKTSKPAAASKPPAAAARPASAKRAAKPAASEATRSEPGSGGSTPAAGKPAPAAILSALAAIKPTQATGKASPAPSKPAPAANKPTKRQPAPTPAPHVGPVAVGAEAKPALERGKGTKPFRPPGPHGGAAVPAAAAGRHGLPRAAPSSLELDIDVVPAEALKPQPKPESAEMLVDLPPEELRGQHAAGSSALPKSGVYPVKPVSTVRESSQPEVAVELTKRRSGDGEPAGSTPQGPGDGEAQKGAGEDGIGLARTLPAVELSAEERAKLAAAVKKKKKDSLASPASSPGLSFEAGDTSLPAPASLKSSPGLPATPPAQQNAAPQAQAHAPTLAPAPGAKPLSEMLARKDAPAWYSKTWVIITMAVVAVAAIGCTVFLLTRSG